MAERLGRHPQESRPHGAIFIFATYMLSHTASGGHIWSIFGSIAVADGFVDALWDVLDGYIAGAGSRARLVGRFRVSVPYPCV